MSGLSFSAFPNTFSYRSSYNLKKAETLQTIAAGTQFYYGISRFSHKSSGNGATYQLLHATDHRLKHINNPETRMPTANLLSITPVTEFSQVYNIQLYTYCSPLNYYLCHKKIIDSLLCSFGQIETNLHFLLECNLYNELRQVYVGWWQVMVSRYCPPSLHSLFIGTMRWVTKTMTAYFKTFTDTL